MTSVTEQLSAAVNQNATMTREGMLERAFARLFRGLVYAQIWEDPVVDMGGAANTASGQHCLHRFGWVQHAILPHREPCIHHRR
jgi:S-adenosylmethionine:diacylglycerol 3-amino-3-carboxypropyl transferase